MSILESASTILTVNIDAIRHNYRLLCHKLEKDAKCAAAVKANAYGLGMKKIVSALTTEGCSEFFVAQVEEGIFLRELFPKIKIYILNGALTKTEKLLENYKLIPVLNDPGQINRWNALAYSLGRPLSAAIHVDTGINRLGLTPIQFNEFASNTHPALLFEITLCLSHLACADESNNPKNKQQLKSFIEMRRKFPFGRASFANSSGIFLGKNYHFDLCRPGIALYGGNPTPYLSNPMKPVVRLQGRILQIRTLNKHETVGYGATYSLKKNSRVGTVATGYADGYLRSNVGKRKIHINGFEAPIIGRISMDMITVDLSKLPEHVVHPGMLVDLIWDDWTIDDLANTANTISNEILTALGERITRVYQETGYTRT